jgi:carbonic anhydrase/acetyltransferase-like protein (isoleucine patch superfamily)
MRVSKVDINEFIGTWDYVTLPSGIVVGTGCYLEDRGSFRRFRSTLEPGLVLGDNVHVYNCTAFSIESAGMVTVGDGSTLVGAIFWCADRISIGRRVVISYNVMIADSDFHPRDPGLRRTDAVAISPQGDTSQRPPLFTRPVVIEDDVEIGMGAIILKGVTIGRGAYIEAGSVVTSSVPAGAEVAGNPARILGERRNYE